MKIFSKNFFFLLNSGSKRTFYSHSRCMNITSNRLVVGEYDLHYEQAGKGKNVMLLLPGAIGCARTDFKAQMKYMNRDLFTIIGWDPPGYGKSKPKRTWPEEWYERDAQVALQFMKTLGYAKYNVMGWGDGGFTALIMASMQKDNIEKLVVWSTHTYVTAQEAARIRHITKLENWSEKTKKRFAEEYGELTLAKRWADWSQHMEQYFQTDRSAEFRRRLERITCPTLIVHGARDEFVHLNDAEFFQKSIPNARLVVMPEAKHTPHLRFGKEFNSLVENFILEPIKAKP